MLFEGGDSRPRRGALGIVPQKNVLFPELTCLQTLRVWKSVKWSENSDNDEDLEQLLRDCDLGTKINANAATLSGGQKRKLQLAIGLLSGSKSAVSSYILLVDYALMFFFRRSCSRGRVHIWCRPPQSAGFMENFTSIP